MRGSATLGGVLALGVACGCGDGGGGASTGEDGGPRFELPDPNAMGRASLRGRAVDALDAPVVGAFVSLCGEACWYVDSDENGAFDFRRIVAGDYYLRIQGPADEAAAWSPTVVDAPLAAEDDVSLPRPLLLPWTGLGQPLPEELETVALTPTLWLTLAGAEVTLPTVLTSTRLAGVDVDPAVAPDYGLEAEGVPYDAVAVWALNPYDATSEAPIGVRAVSPAALAPDAELAWFSVDASTGRARFEASAEREDASHVRTPPEGGIHHLTWLLLGVRR